MKLPAVATPEHGAKTFVHGTYTFRICPSAGTGCDIVLPSGGNLSLTFEAWGAGGGGGSGVDSSANSYDAHPPAGGGGGGGGGGGYGKVIAPVTAQATGIVYHVTVGGGAQQAAARVVLETAPAL